MSHILADMLPTAAAMPGAVSIWLAGQMTYQDDGAPGTVEMLQWGDSAADRISWHLSTAGADTGRLVLAQSVGGSQSGVSTASGDKAPGRGEPFSYAATHAAGELAAASDGASAGSAASAGQPDVSASRLKLFTGALPGPVLLGLLGVAAADIGNTGRQQATSKARLRPPMEDKAPH